MSDLSQDQLERLVKGPAPKPTVRFYEDAVLDVTASKQAGHRIYRSQIFVAVRPPGVVDWVPERATNEHIKAHPEAYQTFLDTRQGTKKPEIDIIPGLEMIHFAELRDMGLVTIEALAGADRVPEHLEYAQRRAARLQNTLTEADNGNQESKQEGRQEKDHQDGQQASSRESIEANGTGVMPAPDRPEHAVDVGRSAVPGGQEDQRRGPGGFREDRQVHSDPGLIGANFSIEIG